MLRIVSFSLLIILQILAAPGVGKVVIAEPPSQHCIGHPPDVTNPMKCCNFPHFFKVEDFEECGTKRPSIDQPYRRGPPDCSKLKCVLNKYKLMKDDEEIDNDAVMEFLDKWVEVNPDYKDAVEMAKENCLKSELPGPKITCEPMKTIFCIKSIIFSECPNWEDTDNCKKLKGHFEECKQYFIKE